jgi:hypothetical protein
MFQRVRPRDSAPTTGSLAMYWLEGRSERKEVSEGGDEKAESSFEPVSEAPATSGSRASVITA